MPLRLCLRKVSRRSNQSCVVKTAGWCDQGFLWAFVMTLPTAHTQEDGAWISVIIQAMWSADDFRAPTVKRPEARALAERVPGGHSARRKAQGDGPIPGFAGFKLSLRTVWRVRGPQAGFPGDSGPGSPGGSAPLLETWGLGSGVAREPACQQLAATWVGGPTGTSDSSASGSPAHSRTTLAPCSC